MGQAAGTAADLALAGTGASAAVDIAELQRRLERDGAYLGASLPVQPEPAQITR
jgi:hypothetical protein